MKDSLIYKACVAVLLVLVLFGGAFITTCLIAGAVIFFAFWVLFQRSATVRWLARTFPVATDLIVTIGTFMLMPEGIMAVLAAATVGILTSGYVSRMRSQWLMTKCVADVDVRGIEVRPTA
jgi:hypothetical protein